MRTEHIYSTIVPLSHYRDYAIRAETTGTVSATDLGSFSSTAERSSSSQAGAQPARVSLTFFASANLQEALPEDWRTASGWLTTAVHLWSVATSLGCSGGDSPRSNVLACGQAGQPLDSLAFGSTCAASAVGSVHSTSCAFSSDSHTPEAPLACSRNSPSGDIIHWTAR